MCNPKYDLFNLYNVTCICFQGYPFVFVIDFFLLETQILYVAYDDLKLLGYFLPQQLE